jgi:hypothetical protein
MALRGFGAGCCAVNPRVQTAAAMLASRDLEAIMSLVSEYQCVRVGQVEPREPMRTELERARSRPCFGLRLVQEDENQAN